MPFEIGFSPSTKTGRPKAMLEGVIRAVERVGATLDVKTQEVTLSSGEQIHLGIDPGGREMLITADGLSLDLSRFAYALADETATLIQGIGLTAATPSGGDPPLLMATVTTVTRLTCEHDLHAPLRKAFKADAESDQEEEERQAAFDKALAKRRAELAAAAPDRPDAARSPRPISDKPRSSMFQRLTDALFGKAI